jgi:hypothetical protein
MFLGCVLVSSKKLTYHFIIKMFIYNNKMSEKEVEVFKSPSTIVPKTKDFRKQQIVYKKKKFIKPQRKTPKINVYASDLTRSNIVINIFNKIFNQGNQIFNKLLTQYKDVPLTSDQKDIKSLVVVFPSCHSSTTRNTYLQNYIEFVEKQRKDYNNFILHPTCSLQTTKILLATCLERNEISNVK